MHWPSFFVGLLTLPALISGLLVVRLLLELALARRARQLEDLGLTEGSFPAVAAPRDA